MTAIQAAERQAMLATARTSIIRPETLERVKEVLARMDGIIDMSDAEVGALRWDAFAALTNLQVDLRLKFEYGVAA